MDWTWALLLALVPAAAAVWFMVCNERTCSQRLAMIKAAPLNLEGFTRAMNRLDRVTYEQHLWALFCGRDPQTLYGPH